MAKIGGGTLMLVGIAALMAAADFHAREREQEESARRAALTPEQRGTEEAAAARDKRLSSARGACLMAVERVLYDPSSAQLERTSTWPIEERKDGSIRTLPHGRAKNAFGAYVYGVWDCTARIQGANIRVVSLKQVRL